jgi:hypothetical protein
MLILFILSYILPLIAMFLIVYLSDDILTVRDLLSFWWTYLIPAFNILMIFIFIISIVVDSVEKRINKNWWNNFLDKRL